MNELANISDLARRSGLSRTTVRRRLHAGWSPADLIEVEAVEIPQIVQGVATPVHHVPPAPGRPWLLGLTCGALGVGLAGVGLVINANYAASLGRTVDESALLAALGLAVDGGAVILLSVAARLWLLRHRLWSTLAFTSWVGFTGASMIATAGFTSAAIGDHAAGRSAAIEQASDQRGQRVEAIEVAKAAVASAITARDQECGKVDENCRRRIAELNQRQAELTTAVAAPTVATAPVSAADPGARLIAELLRVAETSVQRARIAMLTIAPATAALFLAFAVMLLDRRR